MMILLVTGMLGAGGALAGTPVPVNPVFNPGFEAHVPLMRDAVEGTPADVTLGVGHQVLGCGQVARLVWESDCDGNSVDRADAAQGLVTDPGAEADYWQGTDGGDLAIVSPSKQNVFTAVNWGAHPAGSVTFEDHDEDGDREAVIGEGNRMLYQTGLLASTHSAVPMGLVDHASFTLEDGTLGGHFQFVLDSFPLEDPAAYPQMFYNYVLTVPASAWTLHGDVVVIDPVKGRLSGPASGGYVTDTSDHPSPAEWNAASDEEKRAMLMEFRTVQFTFWDLPTGAVVDDVTFHVEA